MRLVSAEKRAGAECLKAMEAVNHDRGCDSKWNRARITQKTAIRASGITRACWATVTVFREGRHEVVAGSAGVASTRPGVALMSFLSRCALWVARATVCGAFVFCLCIHANTVTRIARLSQRQCHVPRCAGDQVGHQAQNGDDASTRTKHDASFCISRGNGITLLFFGCQINLVCASTRELKKEFGPEGRYSPSRRREAPVRVDQITRSPGGAIQMRNSAALCRPAGALRAVRRVPRPGLVNFVTCCVVACCALVRWNRRSRSRSRSRKDPPYDPIWQRPVVRRCATASKNLVAPVCPVFGFLVSPPRARRPRQRLCWPSGPGNETRQSEFDHFIRQRAAVVGARSLRKQSSRRAAATSSWPVRPPSGRVLP